MLCRSCRDHIEAFQNHGCYVPLLSKCPILSIHRGFGLVTPPWRLPSSLASVQKCHGGTNGKCAPTHWQALHKESPDQCVTVARSHAGALNSSIPSACACSLMSLENHSITTKLKLPHHEQTWLGSQLLHWSHPSPTLSAVATATNWYGQRPGLLARMLENMSRRHQPAPMPSTRPD
jgi:hypothetical protein